MANGWYQLSQKFKFHFLYDNLAPFMIMSLHPDPSSLSSTAQDKRKGWSVKISHFPEDNLSITDAGLRYEDYSIQKRAYKRKSLLLASFFSHLETQYHLWGKSYK